MFQEKMLTRIFKTSEGTEAAEKNVATEKAISVISKDVVHLPGNIINEHDIMNSPGKNILDICKVGDHMVAVTPYSVFVNHGGGTSHNTKEYKLNYTMIGNYHNFCTDNRSTIMHVAYDNSVVRFITITEDGVTEKNVTPCIGHVILNCACLYYKGSCYWWVIADNGIYYCKSISALDVWTLVEGTNFNQLHGIRGQKIKIMKDMVNTSSSTGLMRCYYLYTYDADKNCYIKFRTYNGYLIPYGQYGKGGSLDSYSSYQIYPLIKQTASIESVLTYRATTYIPANQTGQSKLYMYIHKPSRSNSSMATSADVSQISGYTEVPMNKNDIYAIFSKSGDIDYAPEPESINADKTCDIAEIWRIPYDTSICEIYNINITYDSSTYNVSAFTTTKTRTINLKHGTPTMINLESPFCHKILRRGVGDEVKSTSKAIYYNTGNIDFFSGNYPISGIFYTFRDTNNIGTSSNPIYDVRSKIDVTSTMELNNINTLEDCTEYVGNGETTKMLPSATEYWSNKIPIYVYIECIENGSVAVLFPKNKFGFASGCIYKGDQMELNYNETTHQTTFTMKHTTASASMNVNGYHYKYYVKFEEWEA